METEKGKELVRAIGEYKKSRGWSDEDSVFIAEVIVDFLSWHTHIDFYKNKSELIKDMKNYFTRQ